MPEPPVVSRLRTAIGLTKGLAYRDAKIARDQGARNGCVEHAAHCRPVGRIEPDALAQLVAGADGIRFSEALAAEGATVFAHACKLGLEGIVSKRAGSRYRSGPSRNWLKSKNPAFART